MPNPRNERAELAQAPAAGFLHAYVSCAEDKTILCFALEPGADRLRPLHEMPVPGSDLPSPSNMPLAFSRDGRRVYAGVRSAPFPVTWFLRDPSTGVLSAQGTAALAGPMAYLALDRTECTLLGASYKAGLVAAYPLAADGSVQTASGTVIEGQPKAHCVISARQPGRVLAAVLAKDEIQTYALEGACLTPLPHLLARTAPGAGPRHMAFHPWHDVLYVVNEHAGTLDVFAAGGTAGRLALLETHGLMPEGFTGNARAADLHVSADGCFAYASVRHTSTITAFACNAPDGRLSPIASQVPVGGSPRGFALSPDGHLLLSASQELNAVELYRIEPDNQITLVDRQVTKGNPSWIVIVPAESAEEGLSHG